MLGMIIPNNLSLYTRKKKDNHVNKVTQMTQCTEIYSALHPVERFRGAFHMEPYVKPLRSKLLF